MARKQYSVQLTTEERERLNRLIRGGKGAARIAARARILIKIHESWNASLSGGGPGRGGRHGVPHQTAVCSRRVGWCPAGPGPGQSGFRKLDDRIVNVSVVVATAVNGEGKREIIGMTWVRVKTAPSGWPSYARCPPGGSAGCELVVSDVHPGTPRRHRRSLRRSQLATVPHALHDQPAHSGPQARPAMGSHHGPLHLPANTPTVCWFYGWTLLSSDTNFGVR